MMPCVRDAIATNLSFATPSQQREHPVTAQAQRCLRLSAYPEIRHVDCNYNAGILTLRGFVPSFYLKQVAQTLVKRVEGVVAINNLLEISD